MSRVFDGTNSHFLSVASATVSGFPVSFSAWVKLASLGALRYVFDIGTSGVSSNSKQLTITAGDIPQCSITSISGGNAGSPASIQDANWHLISGSMAAANSLAVYLDGANKGTGAGVINPSAPNIMRISGAPSGTTNVNGLIAYVGLWNIALSDADHAALALGTPDLVQPANLVEYWPLTGNQSPEPSYGTSPHSMILTGTSFSPDNPIFAGTPYYLPSADYF